jgi:hypothetical protein
MTDVGNSHGRACERASKEAIPRESQLVAPHLALALMVETLKTWRGHGRCAERDGLVGRRGEVLSMGK